MEELYEQKKIRAIGVSNFSNERLADLLWHARIKPMVNQIEINPLIQRKEEIVFCQKNNVVVEAWSPLGGKMSINEIVNNDKLISIAKAKNKTVPQIILRWLIQQDVVVLVKTNNADRMNENIDLFDSELSNEEMNIINSPDAKVPLFDHTSLDGLELIKSLSEKIDNI